MRLSWKKVAETVIAYIPLDDLEKAIATEKRYLETEPAPSPRAKVLALASKPPALATCPPSAPKALGLQAALAHGLKAETSLKLRRE